MKHRVLFRTGWKHIFSAPALENVSFGDGSGCENQNANLPLFGFMIFYFFIICFAFSYIC